MQKTYEDYAVVLDFLPQGYPTEKGFKRTPIVQLFGETHLSLLEAIPRGHITSHERVFIGKGDRRKINHIKRRLTYDDLTSSAKAELPYAVEEVVERSEQRFVDFFNTCRPITIRFHQLELLSGVGKKLMNEILNQRRRDKFTGFDDVKKRIPSVPDPKKMIAKRIVLEMKGEDKYRIFVF
jgi:putative nucleotide binding protein